MHLNSVRRRKLKYKSDFLCEKAAQRGVHNVVHRLCDDFEGEKSAQKRRFLTHLVDFSKSAHFSIFKKSSKGVKGVILIE